jgi:hypothetical protein
MLFRIAGARVFDGSKVFGNRLSGLIRDGAPPGKDAPLSHVLSQLVYVYS